jgi:hypothetical protein
MAAISDGSVVAVNATTVTPGENLFDKPGGLDPAHSRHGQVHDHDVGLQPGDQVDGLFAIRSLPSDLEEWFG